MRIKVLMTDKATSRAVMDERERMLSAAVSAGTEISVDCIRRGPDELDCHTDEVFAAPELVRLAVRAEREGFDAVVIYCFSDVGLEALRENVRIPVIAPGETVPRTSRRMRRCAVAGEQWGAVLALDIPSEHVGADPHATLKRRRVVGARAVERYGADGVILGCLGMAGYGDELERLYPVKVLDPAMLAVAWAELCARLGLRHIPGQYRPFTNESHVEL